MSGHSATGDPDALLAPDARPSGVEWIRMFAERLGVAAPTEAEFTDLLALAGVAAHSSERIAAPVACWLAANAGVAPAAAKQIAEDLGRETGTPGE